MPPSGLSFLSPLYLLLLYVHFFLYPHLRPPSADDGALRIWKNFADQKNPEMVTAWQGLSDMLPTTRGQPSTSTHSKDQCSILLSAPHHPSIVPQWNAPCSNSLAAPLSIPSPSHFFTTEPAGRTGVCCTHLFFSALISKLGSTASTAVGFSC